MSHPPRFAEIAFPIPTRQLFTYRIPESMQDTLQPGCRVEAPFGRRTQTGFVVRSHSDSPPENRELKPLQTLLDQTPLFHEELLRFLNWAADYYMASYGETYSVAYPFTSNARPRMVKVVILDSSLQESLSIPETVTHDNQRKVLEFLINRKALLSPSDIVREVGVSPSTIKTLERKGFVRLESRQKQRIPVFSQTDLVKPLLLSDEQVEAINHIRQSGTEKQPRPVLLYGVTGSGKTEVYLQTIDSVLQAGSNALVLIPEISLTPQTMDRFRNRFGDDVGILHSALGQGERYDEWRAVSEGKRRILVGTRSAVFAPIRNLGIIIVDEEHDSSYKQADPSPRYHARDLAVVRAQLAEAICVLGSATPSVETRQNAITGKYTEIRLRKRIASHGLATIQLVDMRARPEAEEILSNELLEALWDRYDHQQQSILFLNRRGHSTSVVCNRCGHIVHCRHCSVPMVYHQSNHVLICHHCDYREPPPDTCASCTEPFIRMRGFGTEKVVQELEEKMPGISVVRVDRDTIRRKGDHERLLTPFRNGQAHILVGTQMIAKGLDFRNVTLVGVINADYTLALPDFRAAERTFTLLTQVAGRSGRGEHPGEVYIQTYSPDHYSIQLALRQDYDSFFEKEIRYRQLIGFPPFSRLVLWRIEGSSEDIARGKSWELYEILSHEMKKQEGITLLPPVEAPIYRLRDQYRWQVALKSRRYRSLRPLLTSTSLQKFLQQRRTGFRIVQDVDPVDML